MSNTPETDEFGELECPTYQEGCKRWFEFARNLELQRNEACDRLRDILKADDGQAYKEAQKFLDRIGRISQARMVDSLQKRDRPATPAIF